jgi:molybdopterin synthase sulfur carrier subunit
MKVKILAFGIAKDIMGGTSVEIDLQKDMTSAKLRSLLEDQYPRLRQLNSFMLAVNNKYSHGNEVINEQDEIALIPPVSGG